ARLSHILDQEKIKYEKPALELIALASGGALRDAESLLDQVVSFVGQDGKIEKKEVQVILGSADLKTILQFLHFLNRKQAKEAIELINAIIYQSVDLKEFAKMAIGLLREVLFLALDFESQSPLLLSLTETELVDLKGLAVAFSPVELKRITEIIIEAENKMKYASILQLPLELAIIEICTENR
ncbi:MAG: hypothetical protein NTV62_01175, partial [Candidatus Gribaldobacteria bacterium]|nr:hypothetical protein [Candidatus Gribaldobacteria bacterium]